jgi:phage tail-like protein
VRRDPYGASNFEVEIAGEAIGFAEVIGLGCEIAYEAEAERPIVGRISEVTFRRGVSDDVTIWTWVRKVLNGADDPRTVTVTLLDERRTPVCRWTLREARPTKWSGPSLVALGSDVAIEELVLTADGLEFSAVRGKGAPPARTGPAS